jgi:hypothetical protein
MCTVVQYLTHDFQSLVGLLKSCNGQYACSLAISSLAYFS